MESSPDLCQLTHYTVSQFILVLYKHSLSPGITLATALLYCNIMNDEHFSVLSHNLLLYYFAWVLTVIHWSNSIKHFIATKYFVTSEVESILLFLHHLWCFSYFHFNVFRHFLGASRIHLVELGHSLADFSTACWCCSFTFIFNYIPLFTHWYCFPLEEI